MTINEIKKAIKDWHELHRDNHQEVIDGMDEIAMLADSISEEHEGTEEEELNELNEVNDYDEELDDDDDFDDEDDDPDFDSVLDDEDDF